MTEQFQQEICPECASILRELEDARNNSAALSFVLGGVEDQVTKGEAFHAPDSRTVALSRRMERFAL